MLLAKERFKASGIHLGISLTIALCAALLVFAVWYPYPYREISGGRDLFLLVTGVDVVLGPLITLTIFNPAKPRRELVMDLAIIGCIQLAALGYGLWTVAVARPVHLVFEVDRLRAVHAIEVPAELVGRAPTGIEPLPWSGPTLLAVRKFRSASEEADATIAALGGVQLSARPDLWEPYDAARQRVIAAAHPLATLVQRRPQDASAIESAARAAGRDVAQLAYLPVISRKLAWTALIDPHTAQIVGFAPVDSF